MAEQAKLTAESVSSFLENETNKYLYSEQGKLLLEVARAHGSTYLAVKAGFAAGLAHAIKGLAQAEQVHTG